MMSVNETISDLIENRVRYENSQNIASYEKVVTLFSLVSFVFVSISLPIFEMLFFFQRPFILKQFCYIHFVWLDGAVSLSGKNVVRMFFSFRRCIINGMA